MISLLRLSFRKQLLFSMKNKMISHIYIAPKYIQLNAWNYAIMRSSHTTIQNEKTTIESNSISNPRRPIREKIAPITLTKNAAKRINELLELKKEDSSNKYIGVKISVRRRGCNGYTYIMNYATQDDIDSKKDDIVTSHGVTVLVDPKAIFFIVGTVMDFVEDALSAEFTFNNPNSKGECGCGESFNV